MPCPTTTGSGQVWLLRTSPENITSRRVRPLARFPRAREVYHRDVVLFLLLSPDQEPPEPVEQRVGPLDDPSPRSVSGPSPSSTGRRPSWHVAHVSPRLDELVYLWLVESTLGTVMTVSTVAILMMVYRFPARFFVVVTLAWDFSYRHRSLLGFRSASSQSCRTSRSHLRSTTLCSG